MRDKKLCVLIASANGFGNAGDDIATIAIERWVQAIMPGAEVRLTRPPMDHALVDWADVVIVGGGGLLYDGVTANVENYLAYLRAAQREHKTTMVVGVGTQGISKPWAIRAYSEVLNKVSLITVRSEADAAVLRGIGVRRNVYALTEPSFSLMSQFADGDKAPAKRERPVLAVSLANTKQSGEIMRTLEPDKRAAWRALYDNIDRQFGELARHFDVRLVLQSEDDLPLYQRWHKKYDVPIQQVDNHGKPHESLRLIEYYRDADLVLTSRFHGMIFGLLAQRPVAALAFANTKIDWMVHGQLPHLARHFATAEDFVAASGRTLLAMVQDMAASDVWSAIREHVKRQADLAEANQFLIERTLRRPGLLRRLSI